MPMEKRTAQFPLTGGLDQRTAGQLVQAPMVTLATNLYRAKTAEWAHRFGFHYLANTLIGLDAQATPSTMTKIRALGGRGSELVAIAKKNWWSWSAKRSSWIDHSRPFGASGETLDQRVVTHRVSKSLGYQNQATLTSAESSDSAVGNGYVCTAWSQANSVYVQITEEATGQIARTVIASSGVRPKVVHSEGFFLVFSAQEFSGATPSNIVVLRIDSSTLVPSVAVNAATDGLAIGTGNPWFDVQVRSSGNVLIAYRASGPILRALEWDPTTNAASIAITTIVASDVASSALGWVYNAADVGGTIRLLTAVNGATGVVERELNTSTLAQTASTTILASPGDVASITGRRDTVAAATYALWERRLTAPDALARIHQGRTNAVSDVSWAYGACLASKPFLVDGTDWYIAITTPFETQPGYYIVPFEINGVGLANRSPKGVVAQILRGSGQSLPVQRNALSHVAQVTTTKYVLPCVRIVDFSRTSVLNLVREPAYATIDFDGTLPRPISYSRTMVAPGSVSKMYGGDLVAEVGHLLDPEAPVATIGAGGSMTPGSYTYKAVFFYADGEGRKWLSGVSAPSNAVTAAGGNLLADVVIKGAAYSSYANILQSEALFVELYRTKSNGTAYFRVPMAPVKVIGGLLSFQDGTSDANLEQNTPLYTDGGELLNQPPPPCLSMTVVGSRLIGVDAENPTTVFASKELQPGAGVGWHPDMRVSIDADGDNYAVAAMENRTVVFKRQAIYVLTGDWPNANGQGSLPIAQRVAVGFGTTNAVSVRESDQGVWFEDPGKGMCLLTRGLEVVQLGIQAPLVAGFPCLGTEVDENDEQVRVLTNGTIRVWDYLEKQWSTWTQPGVPTCSAVVGGVYYYGTSSGRVAFYNTASFADNEGSGSIEVLCTLALRFSLAGVEGRQRLYRVTMTGRKISSPSTFLVGRFGADYATGVAKTGVDPAHVNGIWKHQFRPEVQRGGTHLLTLTYGSASEGLTFVAAAVEFGIEGGLRKLGASSMG